MSGEDCKEMVWDGGFRHYQCQKKAKRDGYCTIHHPDYKAKKAAERQAKYESERERFRQEDLFLKLGRAAYDAGYRSDEELLAALERYEAGQRETEND